MHFFPKRLKIVFMILLGSLLETYDYALYGYFSTIIAKEFFPTLDPISSMVTTFTIFALGFLARPLGAAVFGNYGDRYGRKAMLMLSILLMAIPTFCIGLLPDYTQWGIIGGVLLTVCRLLQGIAVGAEFVGTMVYMVEQAPPKRRIFFGSLCVCAGYLSMLFVAIIVGSLSYYLSPQEIESWGWRLPFLFGVVLGLIGLYIRAYLPETRSFTELKLEHGIEQQPLLTLIKSMPRELLAAIGLVTLHVSGFYMMFVYLPSFLKQDTLISLNTISQNNTIALISGALFLPLIGLLAEKYDKKYFMMASCVILIAVAYPLFLFLHSYNQLTVLLVQMTLTLLLCMNSAIIPGFIAELFPTQFRYTGMAISYNISAAVFGGTGPLILTYFNQKGISPSLYLVFAATVSLMSLLGLYSTKRYLILASDS